MGVVHHSNYIRWFEEGRVDMMKQIGLDYKRCEEIGFMLPVLNVECQYKQSARFDDEVFVYSQVVFFNGLKMTINYEVRAVESGALLAVGSSKHCFVDLDFKPIIIKKKFPEVYDTIIEITNKGECQ